MGWIPTATLTQYRMVLIATLLMAVAQGPATAPAEPPFMVRFINSERAFQARNIIELTLEVTNQTARKIAIVERGDPRNVAAFSDLTVVVGPPEDEPVADARGLEVMVEVIAAPGKRALAISSYMHRPLPSLVLSGERVTGAILIPCSVYGPGLNRVRAHLVKGGAVVAVSPVFEFETVPVVPTTRQSVRRQR